ncbi:MAG TPA: hypothetical protein PK737_02800 [Bacilli bacterium]|nr:hypothetical protein [Bacilli bacterium]
MKLRTKVIIISVILIISLIIFVVLLTKNDQPRSLKTKDSALIYTLENISVNYISGDVLELKQYTKDPDYVTEFSVTNNGLSEDYYNINLININTNLAKNDNISLQLKDLQQNQVINKIISDQNDQLLLDHIKINPAETQRYSLKLVCADCPQTTLFKAQLSISLATKKEPYFADVLLSNNPPQTFSGDYNQVALTSEGLNLTLDDFGTAYIFRGKVENNYLKFADLMWRIVAINGNGTIKLILDQAIADNLQSYRPKNLVDQELSPDFANFEQASINQFLKGWYDTNLINNDSIIANTKFCLHLLTTTQTDNKQYYNPYFRINLNQQPSLVCQEGSINQKIGLLSADEVLMSGAVLNKANSSYYLYNANNYNSWLTLSPYQYNPQTQDIYIYSVKNNGSLITTNKIDTPLAIRPVISLNNNLLVKGTGGINDPYEIINPN